MTSTMMFWYFMSTIVATLSLSGRIRVGPKHTPMLLAFIRLTSDWAATLVCVCVCAQVHDVKSYSSSLSLSLSLCVWLRLNYLSMPMYRQYCEAPITWNTIIATIHYTAAASGYHTD